MLKRLCRLPSKLPRIQSDDRLILMVAGVMVGIASGLAALALNRSLEAMMEFVHHLKDYPWAFVLPGIGAAVSAIYLDYIMKEGAGHGVPEVIYAVSRYGGLLRLRSSVSRLISSCLTIGSGGSAGPEAPVVMSGAAIGSNIAKLFNLNDRQRVTLVGCGAAGAISSIFNAPIAGLVFVLEVVLGEWSTVNIVPIAIAAVAGTEVSRFFNGNQIAFSHTGFDIGVADTVAAAGLGLATALFSILLTRALRSMHGVSSQVKLPKWGRAAVGGCLVGLLGLVFPDVQGEGYHAIREMIVGAYNGAFQLAAIAIFAKILATSLTLGWGGSGGIFAPSLVVGSFTGLAFYRGVTLLWPSIPLVGEGCFALLGMAGLISGILQAPLTGIFLIVQITGGYEVILPLIVVSAVSTTITHYFEPASFYMKDLVDRGQLLRPGTDARVLNDLSLGELIEKDCLAVTPHMTLREFVEVVKRSTRNHFPVEDPDSGDFLGMVDLDRVRPYLFDTIMYDAVVVEQIMDRKVATVAYGDELAEVLYTMDTQGLFTIPLVVNRRFVGMISKATLLDKYRKELMVQTTDNA
ncbi:chloride channel core [Desulfoluna butyratoxydans]|uniref:Chloride channel core n=2 Tax=Desulfoluna butyratoxydans TaxID=231438 RepID=A0A4U8YR99_9BACT|nr:chloride channel core [Desulfoluna butyratoxydans]